MCLWLSDAEWLRERDRPREPMLMLSWKISGASWEALPMDSLVDECDVKEDCDDLRRFWLRPRESISTGTLSTWMSFASWSSRVLLTVRDPFVIEDSTVFSAFGSSDLWVTFDDNPENLNVSQNKKPKKERRVTDFSYLQVLTVLCGTLEIRFQAMMRGYLSRWRSHVVNDSMEMKGSTKNQLNVFKQRTSLVMLKSRDAISHISRITTLSWKTSISVPFFN